MGKRHINIPIFIPHLGCPNDCVFCNQRKISGKDEFVFANAKDELEKAFETVDATTADVEIAFFGGSFTGIDRGLMCELLELAQSYVRQGKAISIRLSTRPDYIDAEVLDILSRYSVKTIELGIQSINDKVLAACRRGHTAEDSKRAMKLVKEYGFSLVGQMMTGLPESSVEDEIETAEFICENGATAARIYPTVVFCGTELERMSKQGTYTPIDSDAAVDRTARVFEVFIERGVPVIRIGLHASENLASADEVYAGANHPALGERVMSRVYLRKVQKSLSRFSDNLAGKSLTIFAPLGETSKVVGQLGENREKLINEFGIKSVKVVEKSNIIVYNINLEII